VTIKPLNPHLRTRASKIKLLLMDVDGVMTNGKLYYFPDEEGNMIETKGFDSQDCIALQWMQ
jgi:3-deoxy-D-manno-octulosonate 8-phosphate phosphatase (KDO 8-P phosphatase)